MTASQTSKISQRNGALDLARLVAAMLVVGYHYTFYGPAAGMTGVISFSGAGDVMRYGYLGVPFFFLISGYVILNSARHCTALQFITLRALRLYPAYWIAVPLALYASNYIPGGQAVETLGAIATNMTMLQTFLGVPHVDGVYWTLTVELMFYSGIFLLLALGQLHRLHAVAAVLLLAATVFHVWGLPRVLYIALIPEWSPYFITGCALCWLQSGQNRVASLSLLAWSVALNLVHASHHAKSVAMHAGEPVSTAVATTLMLMSLALFAAIVLRGGRLNLPGAAAAGAISYPLYLLHQNIGYAVFNSWGHAVNQTALLLGFSAVLLCLCAWIALVFEPAIRRRILPAILRPSRSQIPWIKPATNPQQLLAGRKQRQPSHRT